jgi:hypothetical protein
MAATEVAAIVVFNAFPALLQGKNYVMFMATISRLHCPSDTLRLLIFQPQR